MFKKAIFLSVLTTFIYFTLNLYGDHYEEQRQNKRDKIPCNAEMEPCDCNRDSDCAKDEMCLKGIPNCCLRLGICTSIIPTTTTTGTTTTTTTSTSTSDTSSTTSDGSTSTRTDTDTETSETSTETDTETDSGNSTETETSETSESSNSGCEPTETLCNNTCCKTNETCIKDKYCGISCDISPDCSPDELCIDYECCNHLRSCEIVYSGYPFPYCCTPNEICTEPIDSEILECCPEENACPLNDEFNTYRCCNKGQECFSYGCCSIDQQCDDECCQENQTCCTSQNTGEELSYTCCELHENCVQQEPGLYPCVCNCEFQEQCNSLLCNAANEDQNELIGGFCRDHLCCPFKHICNIDLCCSDDEYCFNDIDQAGWCCSKNCTLGCDKTGRCYECDSKTNCCGEFDSCGDGCCSNPNNPTCNRTSQLCKAFIIGYPDADPIVPDKCCDHNFCDKPNCLNWCCESDQCCAYSPDIGQLYCKTIDDPTENNGKCIEETCDGEHQSCDDGCCNNGYCIPKCGSGECCNSDQYCGYTDTGRVKECINFCTDDIGCCGGQYPVPLTVGCCKIGMIDFTFGCNRTNDIIVCNQDGVEACLNKATCNGVECEDYCRCNSDGECCTTGCNSFGICKEYCGDDTYDTNTHICCKDTDDPYICNKHQFCDQGSCSSCSEGEIEGCGDDECCPIDKCCQLFVERVCCATNQDCICSGGLCSCI